MSGGVLREWSVLGLRPTGRLFVPDLTASLVSRAGHHKMCDSFMMGLCCTRIARHAGRHAAGDGNRILAVWEA